jgi:hypothetical protein
MYIAYLFALLVFVYVSPALAFWPSLYMSSRTAIAIPFLSILLIGAIQLLLSTFNTFSHNVVLAISIVLFVAAAVRSYAIFSKSKLSWPPTHTFIYLVNLLLILYFAAKLGTTAFETDDEIYSWNMWAVQHYLGEPVDYYYTVSPYPQLFPILIAYCYKLLGSIELQLPVRASFAIFPFCLLTAIGTVPKNETYRTVAKYLLIMILLMFVIRLRKYFSDGLADPMMASALVTSVYFFIQYLNENTRTSLLWLSVCCGIAAAYAKQPALIWTVAALPVIVTARVARGSLPKVALVPSFCLFLSSLLWILGPGDGFQRNRGVIAASQQGRDLAQQLAYAANEYLLGSPYFFILLSCSLLATIAYRRYLDVFVLLVLPSLFAWFLFGAYNTRLGIHVIALCALLLAATNYELRIALGDAFWRVSGEFMKRNRTAILGALFVVSVVSSAMVAYRQTRSIDNTQDLYVAGKITIAKYFGNDASFVYESIYNNPNLVLWIPSNYIYGIFYGHNQLVRPGYREVRHYNIDSLISEIENHRPDYLFYAGPVLAYGIGSDLLYELAETRCPRLFTRVAGPSRKYGYIVYKLNWDSSLFRECAD